MSATNLQLNALSNGTTFQGAVRASIYKKALAIVEDYRANPGGNYTPAQNVLAKVLCQTGNITPYYGPMACSTNVMATRTNIVLSNVSYDFDRRAVVTDASDAAILSQIASDWNMLAGV